MPNGLELSRPQGQGNGSSWRNSASGAPIAGRLGLATLKRTCSGQGASLEDYLPLKPESQEASTAQARLAMRVGSSELFGSHLGRAGRSPGALAGFPFPSQARDSA